MNASSYLPRRRVLLGLAAAMLLPALANAQTAEVKVMISGGFSAAYNQLVPQFERETHIKVVTVRGPSMGKTPQAIPNRLARGEDADVLIMVDEALQKLDDSGAAVKESRTPLANSPIGMAVKKGAPAPDISTVDALKKALLNAKSVAYSDSASGVYIQNVLFSRLGIEEAMKGKAHAIPAEPVAKVVARGDAELGFQQVSELLPVPGITMVGKIPAEVQKITLFSAGMASKAKNQEGARALMKFLSSPSAASTIAKTGLEPIQTPGR